jgi:hypothetical protein
MATFTEYSSQNPYALMPSLAQGLVKIGDALESPLLAPGASLSTDGYGLRTFSGTFVYNNDLVSPNLQMTWMAFRSGQELFSGTRLWTTKSERRFRSGGYYEVSVEAMGIDVDEVGGSVTLPCTEGAGSTAATPVELHPDFANRIGGTYKKRINGAIFDPITKKFTGFSTDTTGSIITSLGQPLAGVRTFMDPRRVIRGFIHADYEQSTAHLIPQKIGRQTYDGLVEGISLIPEWQLPAGDRDQTFLLTSANVEPLANTTTGNVGSPKLIKVNYEFSVSGPGGWNQVLYDFINND